MLTTKTWKTYEAKTGPTNVKLEEGDLRIWRDEDSPLVLAFQQVHIPVSEAHALLSDLREVLDAYDADQEGK